MAMAGLTRSGDPNRLLNLEGAPCRPLVLSFEAVEGAYDCVELDIEQSFNDAGWALCPYGRYMSGLYRGGGGDTLDNLDAVSCCGATDALDRAWGECVDVDISVTFDSAGTVECPSGTVLTGMERSHAGNGGDLYHIERLRCCEILPPAAQTAFRIITVLWWMVWEDR